MPSRFKPTSLAAAAFSALALTACTPEHKAQTVQEIRRPRPPADSSLQRVWLGQQLTEMSKLTAEFEASAKNGKMGSLEQCLEDMTYYENVLITKISITLDHIEDRLAGKKPASDLPSGPERFAITDRFYEAYKGVCKTTLETRTGYKL